jgi:hypothetical protein
MKVMKMMLNYIIYGLENKKHYLLDDYSKKI